MNCMHNFIKFIMALLTMLLTATFMPLALANQPSATQTAEAKAAHQPIQLKTTPKMRNETKWLVYCMERGHYLKMPVSELDIREFIREYMENVDFFKLFFTTEDVQHYQDFFSPVIDVMLRQGTLLPAYSIYDKFLDRADARLVWIKDRMQKPFDFTEKATFRPDRSKEGWPKNWEDANALWENRLKYDLIGEILSFSIKKNKDKKAEEKPTAQKSTSSETAKSSAVANVNSAEGEGLSTQQLADPTPPTQAEVEEIVEEIKKEPKTFEEKLARAKEEVLKRYERLIENYRKSDAMEIQEIYLNTLSHLYDPHSSFLSEYFLEEFDISVRNALVGIGAVLQDKDGYCVINELMAGGPAEKSKQIHTGDKIIGVGQETGKIVDVIGMKLRKTVGMIRGKKDTKVRLLIEPASNPSSRKIVTLVRDEIKLTTKLAKAEIYTIPVGDKTIPIGVIDLPAFYGEGSFSGGKKGFSTTKDVEELIGKLKEAGVKGLILDLRRNGGGFLNEAVDLAGLFIKTGPVVQVRDAMGRINRLWDENSKVVWDGPLIIMVSRLSASATEIVAGALQNHKRAIVVGDKSTHGKGTVQAVLNLSNFDPEQKSAAKVTIQKWYAPNGDSIQLKGVHSDIVLPSPYDYMEIGEEHKDYAMKWDSIEPDRIDEPYNYGVSADKSADLIKNLTDKSEERQKTLDEFKHWNAQIDRVKKRWQQKDWSVNLKEREEKLKADEAFVEASKAREKELAKNNYSKTEVLLDSAKETAEAEKKLKEENKKEKAPDEFDEFDEDAPDYDVQMREALRIMGDWISNRS